MDGSCVESTEAENTANRSIFMPLTHAAHVQKTLTASCFALPKQCFPRKWEGPFMTVFNVVMI